MAVVLIVEDDEQVRVLAEAIIRELGYETLTAATAEQALALVGERSDIDVLFTDIGLQQDAEAGLQLAKDVAARKPTLPVLYTTGQGVTDGMRAMFAEPFGFLPKAAGRATTARRRGRGAIRNDSPRAQAARRVPPRLRGGDVLSEPLAGCDAARRRWNTSAQRSHRSAIRLHVALLAGSRVDLAICWHSAACLRNSSDGFMGTPRASGHAETPFARAQLFRILGKTQPAQSELAPPRSLLEVRRSLRQLQALAHALLIDIRRHHAVASWLDVSAPTASHRTDGVLGNGVRGKMFLDGPQPT